MLEVRISWGRAGWKLLFVLSKFDGEDANGINFVLFGGSSLSHTCAGQ